MIAILLIGVAVVAAFYAVALYNHLVSVKHAVAKAWANIDGLLKQRHNIVNVGVQARCPTPNGCC